jgi:arginine decarboxylase-like protein
VQVARELDFEAVKERAEVKKAKQKLSKIHYISSADAAETIEDIRHYVQLEIDYIKDRLEWDGYIEGMTNKQARQLIKKLERFLANF